MGWFLLGLTALGVLSPWIGDWMGRKLGPLDYNAYGLIDRAGHDQWILDTPVEELVEIVERDSKGD